MDPARNIEVSRAAHRGDERPMREMLSNLLETPDAGEAQRLAAAAFPSPPPLHTQQHTTAAARRYNNPSHRARRHRGR